MLKVGLIGYGQLGKQIEDLLLKKSSHSSLMIFDDNVKAKKGYSFPFASFIHNDFVDCAFFVGLGYLHLRKKIEIINRLLILGRNVPVLADSSVSISPTAEIGEGTIIYPLCTIDYKARIGKGCLLNNNVVLSHESIIGEGSYLSPGVIVSGNVSVGKYAFIGSGAVISNGIKIGDGVKIGIGSVITRDIPDGVSVIGNPMRILDKDLNLK